MTICIPSSCKWLSTFRADPCRCVFNTVDIDYNKISFITCQRVTQSYSFYLIKKICIKKFNFKFTESKTIYNVS